MALEKLRLTLRELRLARGMNQGEFAARLGVDQSAIAHIERGSRNPGFEVLDKWLTECGASLRIEAVGSNPLAAIVDAASGLDEADVHLVARVARALQATPEVTRVQLRVVVASIPETTLERAESITAAAMARPGAAPALVADAKLGRRDG